MKNLKPLILLFAVVILFSCSKKDKFKHEIKLINNLGKIRIYLAPEYNTFSTWLRSSDHSCNRYQYYKFQNSKFPQHIEKNYINFNRPDTFFHFTITHEYLSKCYDLSQSYTIDSLFKYMPRKYLEQNIDLKFQIKEIRKINGKDFAIFAYKLKSNKNKIYQYLSAFAIHKNGIIHFEFISYKAIKLNDNFINRSYNALLTTEIKD